MVETSVQRAAQSRERAGTFWVDVREHGGSLVVRLGGELDLAAHEHLVSVLHDLPAERSAALVMELRDLSFIDCRGARILVAARQRGRRHGQCIRIQGARGLVRRVIELVD